MKLTRRGAIGLGAAAGLVGVAGYGASQFADFSPQLVEGRSRARPIGTDQELPDAVDVVIIGGGNIGAAAAFYLARAGVSVALCEKGAVAGEASGRSVGFVYSTGLPDDDMVFAGRAKDLWAGLNQELGIETGYRRTGLVQRIDDEAGVAYWEEWLARHRPITNNARILRSAELSAFVPASPEWHAAVYDPTDGGAEPTLVAPAYAEAARNLGAKIFVDCAVRGVEMSAGQISAVVTERGTIRTNQVVLAGGSWSSRFLGNMDVNLPLIDAFMWCARVTASQPQGVGALFGNNAWRPQVDGAYTIANQAMGTPITPAMMRNWRPLLAQMLATGEVAAKPKLGSVFFEELASPSRWSLDQVTPFEKRRILEPSINDDVIRTAIEGVRSATPGFADVMLDAPWSGVMSPAVDFRPVVGELTSVPGMVVATGMMAGLAIAPAVGETIAELVQGRQTSIDVTAYSPNRFN